MKSIPLTCLVILLVFSASSVDAQKPGGPAGPGGPGNVQIPKTPVKVKTVVKMLRDEAIQSLTEKDEWPRRRNDFSDEKAMSIDTDELLKALALKLDPSPAMDAYLRWQLLGFLEDDKALLDRKVIKIFENLPVLLSSPEPTVLHSYNKAYAELKTLVASKQHSHASGLSKRSFYTRQSLYNIKRVPPRFIPTIKSVKTEFNQVQQVLIVANSPNIKFRDELARRLPEGHPVLLSFLIYDAKSRAEGQDYSYRKVIDALMLMLEEHKLNRALNATARKALIKQLRRMSLSSKREIILDIQIKDTGEMTVERYLNTIPSSYIQAGVNYLNGRDPAVKLKSWAEIDEEMEDDDDT